MEKVSLELWKKCSKQGATKWKKTINIGMFKKTIINCSFFIFSCIFLNLNLYMNQKNNQSLHGHART